MTSKGYICVVQNNKDTNYLRLAYALALREIFDKVIPIKIDRAKKESWKLHNIVDLYDYTPYDETVMLDSDMLFLSDVSHWWEYLPLKDMWFTVHVRNLYNEVVPLNTVYRDEFTKNKLPSVYNGFFYFQKDKKTKELFEMMKHVCDNWDYCVNKYLFNQKPKMFSTDVAFGLSLKLLGYGCEATFDEVPFPYFTHMKLQNQGWGLPSRTLDGDWQNCVDVSIDNFNGSLGIKLSTLRQFGILHYHMKNRLFYNRSYVLLYD